MANDSMRAGPRGATPQASLLAPKWVTLGVTATGAAFDASGAPSGGNYTEETIAPGAAGTPAAPQITNSVSYRLTAIRYVVYETFGAVSGAITVNSSSPPALAPTVNHATFTIPNGTVEQSVINVPVLNPATAGNSFTVVSINGAAAGLFKVMLKLEPVGGSLFSD